ncbi:MAG: pilus assembly protein TadG-related protein, partial [Acidimicrobiales bacterium]
TDLAQLLRRRPAGPAINDRRGRFGGDDGITAVLVALLLVVLLLFAALAIDGGMAYQSHRQTQNAADTGAMAGVRVLEQLKFYPVCSLSVPAPCTSFTSTASIRSEILHEAQGTGADATSTGVVCYLLDGNKQRIGTELCASNVPPTTTTLAAASGLEVKAAQTKHTYFASVSGFNQTQTSSVAKAFIYNFTGGTGSPFLICGTRATMPSGYSPAINWSYDLVMPNGSGGYTLVSGAAGRYYQIQGSQNPTCGADSNTFKGKGSGETINTLPYDSGITTGNGFQNDIQLSVAGIKPCAPGATVFDGCGMIVPVVDSSSGSGASTTMHVVTWLAWQVWGSGNSYAFAGSPSDPVGTSCGNPISPGGSMKYCGRLLGTASITGGGGSGPGIAGQPHVLRLAA